MFTGLVEEIGEIVAVEASGDGTRLTVRAPLRVELGRLTNTSFRIQAQSF